MFDFCKESLFIYHQNSGDHVPEIILLYYFPRASWNKKKGMLFSKLIFFKDEINQVQYIKN